jgi:hypothetical protein
MLNDQRCIFIRLIGLASAIIWFILVRRYRLAEA